ncbi:MAG: gamma-glutamyl-gamma-aminobutyrate hydrolase family protein [Bacteroidetes bacterium]|nr:gamma-glutamyl-gamma-aminobutyrate hydrolase family protein [Bacteroidota bacterium]
MSQKIRIGITDCGKFANYERWVCTEPQVEIIRLSYPAANEEEVKKCHGIVLTGGEDVHPQFYNQPDLLPFCDDDMDERRDAFELKIIDLSQQYKLPLLGICRGLQIANVFFGGTLIPDLPAFGKFNHSKFKEGTDRHHSIKIDSNSFLHSMVDATDGVINSAHHQSANRIGKGLVACAFSEEGVVEAIERKKTEGSSFLMLVQWHPERMTDQQSPMTKNIKRAFIEACLPG